MVESMQQSSATPSLHLGFLGCGRLLHALNHTLQWLLVSTVFGTVSSLHLNFIFNDFYTCNIRESVDSLCRDGADMPMTPYIGKACTRPFCTSHYVPNNTHKLPSLELYTENGKTAIFSIFFFFFFRFFFFFKRPSTKMGQLQAIKIIQSRLDTGTT